MTEVALRAHQEVSQGVPESGQAPFAQKRRVVNLVDAHVRTSRKIFALPHTDVGASLGNHLMHTRHGGKTNILMVYFEVYT